MKYGNIRVTLGGRDMTHMPPPQYCTPTPPPTCKYIDYPHYKGEVIDIELDTARGIYYHSAGLGGRMSNKVTPVTNYVAR